MTGFANIRDDRDNAERAFGSHVEHAARRRGDSDRFKARMTIEDGAAVLYRCGCVASMHRSSDVAYRWLKRVRPNDPDRWEGATVVRARSSFVGPRLAVWRLPDDTELPYARGRCRTQTGGARECA